MHLRQIEMNTLPATIAQRPPVPLLRVAATAFLLVVAVGISGLAIAAGFGAHSYSDFHIFWDAGRAVLHGHDPYPAASPGALHGQNQFVYPAPAALVMVPFALLPLPVAATAFLLLSILALAASLHLLGVRDLRCHAAAFISLAALQGLVMGTVTPVLMLALAAAWRFRGSVRWVAAAGSCAIGLKLFLAPAVIWLVATRRWRAAMTASAVAGAVLLAAWAVVGISTLRTYPALLSALTKVEGHFGFSTYALLTRLGVDGRLANAAVMALVVLLAVAAVAVAGRDRGDGRAFAIAVVACLVASPIVWLHYLALLLVPIAVLRPAFSWAWALPVSTWVFANANSAAPTWKLLAAQAVLLAVLGLALRGVPGAGAAGRVLTPRPAHSQG
jgi:hypothetical protein